MKKIKTRILISYLLLAFSALLLILVFASIRISDYLEQVSKDRIKRLTSEVKRYSENHIQTDYNSAYNKIKIIGSLCEARITFLDSLGKVWFDSEVNEENISGLENHLSRQELIDASKYNSGLSKRYSYTIGQDMLYHAIKLDKPIDIVGIKIKYIRTAIPVLTINHLFSEIEFIIAVSGIISLIIVIIVSFQISKWISKPLSELTEFAIDLKNGILSRRYNIKRKDEIGILADSLNQMADKVEKEKKEVERLEKIKNEFLTNITHELRTPLFIIENSLEALKSRDITDANIVTDFAQKAFNQTRRLHTSIDNLILISRLKSGEQHASLRSIPAETIINETIEKYQEPIIQKGIKFERQFNYDKKRNIIIDKRLLEYALDNLFDNAIKFTETGGTISFIAESEKDKIKIIIADSGKGIKEADLKLITEYFYRPDISRSTETGGAGLGLAIFKQIIEMHNGELIIESQEGKGSRFGFILQTQK